MRHKYKVMLLGSLSVVTLGMAWRMIAGDGGTSPPRSVDLTSPSPSEADSRVVEARAIVPNSFPTAAGARSTHFERLPEEDQVWVLERSKLDLASGQIESSQMSQHVEELASVRQHEVDQRQEAYVTSFEPDPEPTP